MEQVMYNRHHVWFERNSYKTPIEKRVRNMGAFIIKVNIADHQELHANVTPPPKPDHEQLHDLYNFMQEHLYEVNGLEGLQWAIAWANDRKLYEVEANLTNQERYLSGDHKR